MRRNSPLAALSLLALLVCAGCNVLPQPVRESTRYYVLSPELRDSESNQAAGAWTLGLARVEVPAYLSSNALVTRVGESEIRFARGHRWGESLDDGIRRVLKENLDRLPQVARVVPAPYLSERIDYEIRVRILSFESISATGEPGGDIRMIAAWEIQPFGGEEQQRMLASGLFEADPGLWQGEGYGAMVEGLSRALAELSRELADALPPPREQP